MRDRAPALRVYRGLLWLYPAEFRDHFAGEMCRALADCLRQRPDPVEVLWLYLGVFIDAPKERYHMIRQDVVYALRTMRREKLSSLVAVLVLALGIGSTATVFTLVNGMLLKPLPYPDQDRIVYVEEVSREITGAVAYPNYRDFQDRNRTLEDIAMFGSGLAKLRGDTEAERVPAGSGTEPLFRILGVQPLLGRTFTVAECGPGGPSAVLVGGDLWRRRYGRDPGIVGKTIGIGSDQARVVGVMPSGFHFPDVAELWMPLQLNPKNNTRGPRAGGGCAAAARGDCGTGAGRSARYHAEDHPGACNGELRSDGERVAVPCARYASGEAGAVHADGGGGVRAADRVREYHQPVAGQGVGTHAGDRRAGRAGSVAGPAGGSSWWRACCWGWRERREG